MKFDVVTFGSAVLDTFIDTNEKSSGGKISYNLGSKYLINNLRTDVGGGGTNTATAFSRLGLTTGCICKVGNDNNGNTILDLLIKEKIKPLVKAGNKKTGYSVIIDSQNKGRTILTYKGESNNITIHDIPKFKSKWLYFSSLLEKSFKTQKELAKRMHKKGTKLAFNPSEYHIKNENLTQLLKITHLLILNKEEAEMLVKKHKLRGHLLHNLTKLGPKVVVITDKNKPVQAYDGIKIYHLKPHNNIKVIERTGAGDAFASGFTAGLIAGWKIPRCLALALRESENVITHYGAKNNLIRMKIK